MASTMLSSHTPITRQANTLRSRQPQVSSRSTRLVVRASRQSAPRSIELPAALKPVVLTVVSNVLLAAPAFAGGGAIFDFGLTMPIMAGQFLLLMVYLDKGWFGPVGKVLDGRDEMIREKLASVGDNSKDIAKLENEASQILKDARAEAQGKINAARSEAQGKMAEKFNAAKMEVDKDLETAFSALEKEKANAMTSMDAQIEKMGADILSRVLPEGCNV